MREPQKCFCMIAYLLGRDRFKPFQLTATINSLPLDKYPIPDPPLADNIRVANNPTISRLNCGKCDHDGRAKVNIGYMVPIQVD